MANVTDSHGDEIWSKYGWWYKITLADGRELGLGDVYPGGAPSQANGRRHVKVVPAGQGMVFRYQRQDGGSYEYNGWPAGDKGYLRGLQVQPDGSEVIMGMSLSWTPAQLCMYNDNTSYGIVVDQLPNNRVALYGYNQNGTLCGMRVTPEDTIIAHESKHALALDVAFVKVSTGRFNEPF